MRPAPRGRGSRRATSDPSAEHDTTVRCRPHPFRCRTAALEGEALVVTVTERQPVEHAPHLQVEVVRIRGRAPRLVLTHEPLLRELHERLVEGLHAVELAL